MNRRFRPTEPTRYTRAFLTALLVVGALAGPAALWDAPRCLEVDPERFVPIDELRPGDRCVGLTVLSGTDVEEFEVEILGIVRGSAPGSDLIIARAYGEILEKTGILQGMSGSPVYKEGRLVGALSATWPFTKEPIAVITPIAEMLPALSTFDEETGVGARGGSGALGSRLFPEGEFTSSRIGWVSGIAGVGNGVADPLAGAPVGVYDGREMVAIGVPLVTSAGGEGYLGRVARLLEGTGLVPVGGASGTGGETGGEIEPGSAVGVQFVRGDASWTAIGTVTHVDGDRILAFGHPLFNAGAIESPMVDAYVHTLLPLQSVSSKFASGGELIGTFVQDRRRMVAGRLGPAPTMIPLTVRVREAGYASAEFDFEILRTHPYSSLFAALAVSGAVTEALKAAGPASAELAMEVASGDDVLTYGTTFYTSDAAFRAGGELAAMMDFLIENPFEEREISSMSLDLDIRAERRSAIIERVDMDRAVYRPGDEVVVRVVLGQWQGAETTETLRLKLPARIPDEYLVLRVGGAESYHLWEAERLGAGLMPRNLEQYFALIDRSKPGNAIVAQILSERPGLSLSGGELRDIPGRAALAMASSAASGEVDPVEFSMVSQAETTIDRQVEGFHELLLVIRHDGPADK